MKLADNPYIIVGKLGSTYGLKGWLKVQAYTEFGPDILNYQPWHIRQGQASWQPITVEDGHIHGKSVVIKLAELNTPEEARLWTGRLIAIQRSQLPSLKKGEYYWSDLIGLTVINQEGRPLGKVTHLMETGSNDVLVIKSEQGEQAIPFLRPEIVTEVDLIKQEIHVNWELI